MDTLIFKANQIFYGMPFHLVTSSMLMREVPLYPLPSAKNYVKGIVFHMGNVVPLIQLENDQVRQVILCQFNQTVYALAVNDIIGIYNPKDQIFPFVFQSFDLDAFLGAAYV